MADNTISVQTENAGFAFGTLIQKVGEAVAESSMAMNMNGAATATTLATTKADVIAVEETIYNDDGTRKETKTHIRKLPLINFMDPVFYEWASVRLQGVFMTEELKARSTNDTSTTTSGESFGQGGLLLIFGGGSSGHSDSSTSTSLSTDYSRAASSGSMRMNAVLQPKTDIGVPKPRLNVQGPQILIMMGQVKPPDAGKTVRSIDLLIQYVKNGNPISKKTLSIETDGVAWSYAPATETLTDEDGIVRIELSRDLAGSPLDSPPQEHLLTVRKGLVSNTTTVRL
jgi:hypothetical protein